MAKHTTIIFTFDAPTGKTSLQGMRKFVRDADGTDHPHDFMISVPEFTRETLTFQDVDPSQFSESALITAAEQKFGAGVIAVETRHVVTIDK